MKSFCVHLLAIQKTVFYVCDKIHNIQVFHHIGLRSLLKPNYAPNSFGKSFYQSICYICELSVVC